MRELIPLDLIDPNPWQPRTGDDPEHLSNLAVSIAKDGLLQPPAARKVDERYQLAFGHSRFKAFQYLCLMAETDINWFADHGIDANLEQFESMPLEIFDLDNETMYRHAISENLQRKDLTAIEEAAAMKRAMDEFGYNSDKVGELFGKNGATVRGMVRFLELPESAQGMLNKGELSQNGARALLSMQRIAPAGAIEETVQHIREGAGKIVPEQQVASDITRLQSTVTMWGGGWHEGGKPRSGRGGWLLDMKNFPNNLLEDLDKDEIVKFLGVKPADRQANMIAQHAHEPSELIKMLKTSEWSMDRPLGEKLEHLINPPACTACSFYLQIQGNHVCGMKACYARKSDAWDMNRIQSASRQLKIALYTEADGPYMVLESDDGRQVNFFKEHHPDLRLISKDALKGNRRYFYQNEHYFKGIDDDYFLAVLVGKGLEEWKAVKKADRAAGKTETSRWQLLEKRKKDLQWQATTTFAELLGGLNFVAVSALIKNTYWEKSNFPSPPKSTEPEDAQLAYLRRCAARHIISGLVSYSDSSKSVVILAERLVIAATQCGLTPPEDILSMAASFDEEINERFPEPAKDIVKDAQAEQDEDDKDSDPDAELDTELEAE